VSDALVHLAEPTTIHGKENDDDEELSRDEFGNVIPPPAWEDSDDNQLTISLAGDSRLRKLRNTETEDLISGREYIRRLRRQFLQLHPTPAWADPGQNSQHRKKASKVNSDESDAESNTDEMGADGNEVSAQPLAKLLQRAGDIIQRPNDSKRIGKRRLRQEMIEIHRLKDVGVDQPVSAKWKLARKAHGSN
jgi:U3 small nucleolar RNA-associated protein 18